MVSDLINHAYEMKPPLTNKRVGFRVPLILVNTWGLEGNALLQEAWEPHILSPYPALCISSIWLFLSHTLSNW